MSVVELGRNVLIEVTQEDIEKGHARSGMACAVALAAARAVGTDVRDLYVTYSSLSFRRGGKTLWFKLPEKAVKFIEGLEEGEAVEPFSFEVTPFEPTLPLASPVGKPPSD